jgi:hypothetical protein
MLRAAAAGLAAGIGAATGVGATIQAETTMRADADLIPGPLALHQEILRRVAAVEEAVAALSIVRARMGHNNPPEPIEFDAFDNRDQQAINAAISIVRKLPAAPETPLRRRGKRPMNLRRSGPKLRLMPQSKVTISFQKSSRRARRQR